jgi:CRISPR type III-A-associated RAMP protein Csm4
LIDGETISISNNYLDDSGRFLFSEPQQTEVKILTRQVQQRVYIPHSGEENQNSQPYFIERMYFAEKAGMFFMVQCSNKQLTDKLMVCMRVLGDTGFGTDKNVGNGQFDAVLEDLNIRVTDNPKQKLALSLFCPQPEAVKPEFLIESSFLTIKRGGYIVSADEQKFRHFRKKSVHMFAEGSVFPYNIPDSGKIVDLKPETVSGMHPVWRDGACLFLPVKL